MKEFEALLPPPMHVIHTHSEAGDINCFSLKHMQDMFSCGAIAGYTRAIQDVCEELRKLGDESKTLKLVFDSIAEELKERLK